MFIFYNLRLISDFYVFIKLNLVIVLQSEEVFFASRKLERIKKMEGNYGPVCVSFQGNRGEKLHINKAHLLIFTLPSKHA